MFIAIGAALPATASAVTLAEKRAEAARITTQVEQLDHQVDDLQERYRGSQIRLEQLDGDLARLNLELERTRSDLAVAERRLIVRAVAVYRQGSQEAKLLNLARAGSVDRLFSRIEALRRVSSEDAEIVERIRDLRAAVSDRKVEIREARAEQVKVVDERRKAKADMEERLARRQAVLGSVNAEIRQMVAAEQARRAAAAAAAARASARNATIGGGGAGPSGSADLGAAINPGPPPPSSGSGGGAASVAMRYIGVPYRWGGASPSGFDCSGLVMYAYAQSGVSLPHSSYAQWGAGPHVSRDQLQPGDLVFFDGGGHVGIYLGGGSYVHAPHSGSNVRVDSLGGSWESSSYMGATRVL